MALLLSPSPSRRDVLTAFGAVGTSLLFAPASGASQGAAGPLRLALLADTHIPANSADGHRGFSPVDNLTKVVGQVTATRVDGALIGGDLARLAGLSADYARLRDLIAPLTSKMPVGLVLGNHDHRQNFLQAFRPGDAAGPLAASATGKTGHSSADVADKVIGARDVAGLRFVLLDSLLATNVTPGQLGKAQREWLAKGLASSPAPTILLVHHTLGTNDGELVDVDRLFEVVRPHTHVKAIMYGHSHKYEVLEREGLQLINLPAVGYNFNDNEPVGWVESVWTPEGVDLTLRAIGGNMSANGQTTSVHWGW